MQNTACTNFATEKVIVLASPGKVINEEDGIRMFSLSQMTKVKLVCALAWRENFAKGNNSVTDTKRRMPNSQLLIGGTSWLSDGEGQSEDVACHSYSSGSMVNDGCPLTSTGCNAGGWVTYEEWEKRTGMFG